MPDTVDTTAPGVYTGDLTPYYIQKVFDIEDSGTNLKSFLEIERVVLVDNPVPAIERTKGEVVRKYGVGSTKVLYKQKFTPNFDPSNNKLIGQYIISLSHRKPINQITLSVHNFGENAYVKVNRLQVFDSGLKDIPTFKSGQMIVNSTSLSENQYSRSLRWIFPVMEVSQVLIELEQSYCYPVRYSLASFSPYLDLYHEGTVEEQGYLGVSLLDISDKRLFNDIVKALGSTSTLDAEAVNTSLDLSVANLGEYFDATDLYNPICPGMEDWIPGDPITLCRPVPTTGVHWNQEIGNNGIVDIPREESNRYRYAIGVSDINFGVRDYDIVSTFVSNQYGVENLSEISMETNDYTPREFGDGAWLRYYISFDNGANFLRINPRNYNDQKFDDGFVIPKTIYCNSETPDDYRTKDVSGLHAFYDSTMKIETVRVKVEMFRPNGEEYKSFTPIVYAYKLFVRPFR